MPTFTTDWFTYCVPAWRKHVVPALAGVYGARWLEVGSYEGRSALWTLDNVLTSPGSTITCVDPWVYESPKHASVEATFDANVAGRKNLFKLRGRSQDVLPTLPFGHFHGAYVDGSHEVEDVLHDIDMLLPLLRDGAIIVFDDYEGIVPGIWREYNEVKTPGPRRYGVKEAVDEFVREMGGKVAVLHAQWQFIARVGSLSPSSSVSSST